ncbi:MAG: hypothetical protein FWE96_00740 [Coriobacteriia bacterium]|nr:hypothetical protein [Coriobacteriia bacterium]
MDFVSSFLVNWETLLGIVVAVSGVAASWLAGTTMQQRRIKAAKETLDLLEAIRIHVDEEVATDFIKENLHARINTDSLRQIGRSLGINWPKDQLVYKFIALYSLLVFLLSAALIVYMLVINLAPNILLVILAFMFLFLSVFFCVLVGNGRVESNQREQICKDILTLSSDTENCHTLNKAIKEAKILFPGIEGRKDFKQITFRSN